MPNPPGQGIVVSYGEIRINEFYFVTTDYQPPQYTRSLSYEDTAVSETGVITPARSITDMGPLKGVWAQFTLQCHNNSAWDPEIQPWRGKLLRDRILHLFTDFIGEALTLVDNLSGDEYQIMFGAEGITQLYADGNRGTTAIINGEMVTVGPEYDCKISLIEV